MTSWMVPCDPSNSGILRNFLVLFFATGTKPWSNDAHRPQVVLCYGSTDRSLELCDDLLEDRVERRIHLCN